MSKPPKPSVQTPKAPSVVIVGGGMGGIQAAKTLAKAPVEVTLVDTRNNYLVQPPIQSGRSMLSLSAGAPPA